MSMQQEMVDDVFEGLDAEWADDDDEGSSRRSWTRLGWTCHRCRHFSIYL